MSLRPMQHAYTQALQAMNRCFTNACNALHHVRMVRIDSAGLPVLRWGVERLLPACRQLLRPLWPSALCTSCAPDALVAAWSLLSYIRKWRIQALWHKKPWKNCPVRSAMSPPLKSFFHSASLWCTEQQAKISATILLCYSQQLQSLCGQKLSAIYRRAKKTLLNARGLHKANVAFARHSSSRRREMKHCIQQPSQTQGQSPQFRYTELSPLGQPAFPILPARRSAVQSVCNQRTSSIMFSVPCWVRL